MKMDRDVWITILLVRFGGEFGLRHIWIRDQNVFHEFNRVSKKNIWIFYLYLEQYCFQFTLRRLICSWFAYSMHSHGHYIASGELQSLFMLQYLKTITIFWRHDLLRGDDLNGKLQDCNKIYVCIQFVHHAETDAVRDAVLLLHKWSRAWGKTYSTALLGWTCTTNTLSIFCRWE